MGVYKEEPERQARTPPSIAQGTSRSPKFMPVRFHFGGHSSPCERQPPIHWNLSDGDLGEILSSRKLCSGLHPWVFPTGQPKAQGTAPSLQLICEPARSLQASHSSNHTSPLLIFHRSHGLSNSSPHTPDNLLPGSQQPCRVSVLTHASP